MDAPGLASETWDPTNSPQLRLVPGHDPSRAENHPHPKTCHLERSAAESKDLRLFFILFSKPINRTQPRLVSGHNFSRAEKCRINIRGLQPLRANFGKLPVSRSLARDARISDHSRTVLGQLRPAQ